MKVTTMKERPSATDVAKLNHPILALVFIRIFTSFAWLDSAFVGKDAKFSASFLNGSGLTGRIDSTFVHTALNPGVAHLLTGFVEPHAALFGVMIAAADAAIGISLLFGLFTRAGGMVAILRAATNIAVVGGAGADTVGFNLMLILIGLTMIVTAGGRVRGIDATLLRRYPNSRLLKILA